MKDDEYYLGIAEAVSKRSKCLKVKVGAIIVIGKRIVSAGYNGPPAGYPHCRKCARSDSIPGNSAHDPCCPSVHAEANAIVNAAKHGSKVEGGTLYLFGHTPCSSCTGLLLNSGLEKVVTQKQILVPEKMIIDLLQAQAEATSIANVTISIGQLSPPDTLKEAD